jgi:hypothetical protein
MWDPQRFTTLRASTACYRDNFTFLLTFSSMAIKAKARNLFPEGMQAFAASIGVP